MAAAVSDMPLWSLKLYTRKALTELPDSQASEVDVDRLVGTHQGGAASLRYPGIAAIVGCTILHTKSCRRPER